MLYHYFGNKAALFHAVLTRKMAAKSRLRDAVIAGGLLDSLPAAFEATCQDPDWVRLMEWEALERGSGPLIAEDERRRSFAAVKAAVALEQARGTLPAALDPGHLVLTFLSLVAFTLFAPQAARIITGLRPTDPEFRRQRAEFLRRLADQLRPRQENGAAPAARRIL